MTPERSTRQGHDLRTGWVGPVQVAPTPTPQSKPVTHASRLVAQDIAPLVAFGLGPGILAAGPVTYRHYSYRCRLCKSDLNSLLGLVRERPAVRSEESIRSTSARTCSSPATQPG